MRLLALALLPLATALSCAATGGSGEGRATVDPPPGRTLLSGTVTYYQREALAADAVLQVRVYEVQPDGTRRLHAERSRPTNGAQVPLSFTVPGDPRAANPRSRFEVEAEIRASGQTHWVTPRPQTVFRLGGSTEVEIVLQPAN